MRIITLDFYLLMTYGMSHTHEPLQPSTEALLSSVLWPGTIFLMKLKLSYSAYLSFLQALEVYFVSTRVLRVGSGAIPISFSINCGLQILFYVMFCHERMSK